MPFSNEERERIINALSRMTIRLKCPVCQSSDLSLVDGYINDVLQDVVSGSIVIGGTTLPKLALTCNRCTHIMYLSAGLLGLIER